MKKLTILLFLFHLSLLYIDSDSSSLKNIGALMSTVACCESPKITLLIGNGFGSDYFALVGFHLKLKLNATKL